MEKFNIYILFIIVGVLLLDICTLSSGRATTSDLTRTVNSMTEQKRRESNDKSTLTPATTVRTPEENEEDRQIFLGASGKETSTPNFVRLVVMRLIYGIASTMGLEDRLEGVFNGVFVPPNADDDLFGFGGGSDDDGIAAIFEDTI
ncbi:uncharacterized protein LOC119662795 [Teleopsis dalmanni]|uniref:uncharacterized protein LOC119662795 n=1 Tax=Teleopsis dalmanni TaxID=139649 RepID=UPI0018CE0E19|nr:uncharacterized protein LOC119662795 [Teleopsis dalmanni]